jgi:hypothetical protein
MTRADDAVPRDAVITALEQTRGGACLVNELYLRLAESDIDRVAADRAFSELEAAGEIVQRQNYCADPHLDGADLRVLARVPSGATPGEGAGQSERAQAEEAAERYWSRWLDQYLGSHRCT